MTTRHLALLRGINVGGNNVIPMAKLRAAFEALGFDEVETYIASGNVAFSSAKLPNRDVIEAMLAQHFSYAARIVLLKASELKKAVAEAPSGFGEDPETYRYDVLFARAPVKAKTVLPQLAVKDGVDAIAAGTHALYFRRLIAKASQSKLVKLMSLPVYKELTVRNWNTTSALLELATSPSKRPLRAGGTASSASAPRNRRVRSRR